MSTMMIDVENIMITTILGSIIIDAKSVMITAI